MLYLIGNGMSPTRRALLKSGFALALASGCNTKPTETRIGFIVKMPQEQWFQSEWRFARAAANDLGFRVIEIGAEDGDRVLAALETLRTRRAAGFVICAPDPRLGPAIAGFSQCSGLKALAVDDRLVDARDHPISSIPYVGISAEAIGRLAGSTAAEAARKRGWQPSETGVLRIAYDSLETGRIRTTSAVAALRDHGFSKIFDAPQRTTDTEGAFTAAAPLLTAKSGHRRWIIVGLNDESVVGGVRAAEGLSLASADVIGIGIGGSEAAVAELAKPVPTGFHASVLLSPRRHGYDTAATVFRWATTHVRPPAVTLTTGELIDRTNFRRILAREGLA